MNGCPPGLGLFDVGVDKGEDGPVGVSGRVARGAALLVDTHRAVAIEMMGA